MDCYSRNLRKAVTVPAAVFFSETLIHCVCFVQVNIKRYSAIVLKICSTEFDNVLKLTVWRQCFGEPKHVDVR